MSKQAYIVNWNNKDAKNAAALVKRCGWEVAGMESKRGDKALQALAAKPPDAVIIYLTSQPADGAELAQAITQDTALAQLPILFVGGAGKLTAALKQEMPDAHYLFLESLPVRLQQLAEE